jgi:hypothetical protein
MAKRRPKQSSSRAPQIPSDGMMATQAGKMPIIASNQTNAPLPPPKAQSGIERPAPKVPNPGYQNDQRYRPPSVPSAGSQR